MMTNKELEDAIYQTNNRYRDANELMRPIFQSHLQCLLNEQITRASQSPYNEQAT